MSALQQEEYLANVRNELQSQMMQELMTKITERCFSRCAAKTGNYLEYKEQTCLSNCVDRYMETMTVVNQALASRHKR
jgi:import inner membrane translocase subunit TIM13